MTLTSTPLGGRFFGPSYSPPGPNAPYYSPDDGSDPRHHYGSQYVRDFTYTFTMAPDLVPGGHVGNILDWLISGQLNITGSMPEGGNPPARPGQNCWDNGPFVAGLLTQGVPGVLQDPLAPRRGPLEPFSSR